ncbi:ATP-dependent helicase [Phytoactinopolyspora alkaliphila]|uniref:DNA 3'-5' helicase n=1 Tax=Phytoactinopolyspora alkaliphila TaxID=1783498 RepID=A0A6N9YQA4_9ACTN|nr:ATP-dependent DNA helicase [Phytoactinopolyspora alkaliphila]NED97193.1 ATP-dependent helicase [Phytoactinopolyspora alkaliphila]
MRRSTGPDVRLVRRAGDAVVPPPVLDDDQRWVVEHRGGPLLVLAGPGTGKTTTLVESVVHRVEHDGLLPEQVLVLTFSRRAAAELRERIARRLGRTVREPLARTFHSYAFGLLRRESVLSGEPAPRLISGPEQDLLIRDLLRGDVEELGAGYWPANLHRALLTRGFARELRDFLMRAVERGMTPEQLAHIGRRHGREDWVAAARFAHQYSGVTALRKPPSYDQAELVRSAAGLLRDDPQLLARERAERQFVVVDEYQDSDPAQEELLQLLSGGGRDLLVVGDPDQSIYGFRGAEMDGIRDFPERFAAADGQPAAVCALTTSRRSGPALLAATRRVAHRLGGPHRHRDLVPADEFAAGESSVHVLASPSQEAAFIAAQLREEHLFRDVPWQRMAVLVRASASIPVLRRALSGAGVPTTVRLDEVPLVEQPAVRALLAMLELAAGQRDLDVELAFDLVTGILGSADPLGLRRLRQELRKQELAAGGVRASGELLVEAIEQPLVLVPLDEDAVAPAARIASLLAAGRRAAAEPGATAEDVLWAVWATSGLGRRWSGAALSGGRAAKHADRDLDAVVALFDAVARYVDRMPGAGPAGFLEHIRGQQIPSDTLATGPRPGTEAAAVTIMTAHASKGLEWDVVAVAGVQEGVWPDLRERGSLLGIEELVDLVAAREATAYTRASARLAEERRLFYVALTRAKSRLIVTAVSNEDEQPSRFLDDLDPLPAEAPPERTVEKPGRGLDLSSLVAELRRVVCDPAEPLVRRRGAAVQLARLASEGVRQADPGEWFGLRELSVTEPLGEPDQPVRVSPSRVEEFNRCELRWLLKTCGATDSDMTRAGVGTLVHDLAEKAVREQWPEDAMLAELDRVWPNIDVGEGWAAAREYARVQEMVRRLSGWLKENPRRLVGVELDFDIEVGRARLVGRVDRLDADADGRLVVVDYKTGKSKPTAAEVGEHAQLATYQLAVENGAFDDAAGGERRSGGASLVQLGKPSRGKADEQRQPPLDDAQDPVWAQRLLEETANGMTQPTFQARRGSWCGFCSARPCCPAFPEGEQVTG